MRLFFVISILFVMGVAEAAHQPMAESRVQDVKSENLKAYGKAGINIMLCYDGSQNLVVGGTSTLYDRRDFKALFYFDEKLTPSSPQKVLTDKAARDTSHFEYTARVGRREVALWVPHDTRIPIRSTLYLKTDGIFKDVFCYEATNR